MAPSSIVKLYRKPLAPVFNAVHLCQVMPNITPELCRSARALLGWGQRDLADRTRTTALTVLNYERRKKRPTEERLLSFESAFREAGVTFDKADGELIIRQKV